MVASFQEFRDRFPSAHLRSELLMVQGDQFVVRVTIETQTAGSASGLAADPQLEVAEDRARQRALAGWGGEIPRPLAGAASSAHGLPAAQPLPPIAEADDDIGPFPAEDLAPVTAWTSPPEPDPEPERDRPATVSQPMALPVAKAKTAPKSQPPSSSGTAIAATPAAAPAVTTEAALPSPQPPATIPLSEANLPPPINLSDVIAQTDIELRRLGWSVEQGREYLEQTYHKRSRHELSEDELIEFLCYLESQSL